MVSGDVTNQNLSPALNLEHNQSATDPSMDKIELAGLKGPEKKMKFKRVKPRVNRYNNYSGQTQPRSPAHIQISIKPQKPPGVSMISGKAQMKNEVIRQSLEKGSANQERRKSNANMHFKSFPKKFQPKLQQQYERIKLLDYEYDSFRKPRPGSRRLDSTSHQWYAFGNTNFAVERFSKQKRSRETITTNQQTRADLYQPSRTEGQAWASSAAKDGPLKDPSLFRDQSRPLALGELVKSLDQSNSQERIGAQHNTAFGRPRRPHQSGDLSPNRRIQNHRSIDGHLFQKSKTRPGSPIHNKPIQTRAGSNLTITNTRNLKTALQTQNKQSIGKMSLPAREQLASHDDTFLKGIRTLNTHQTDVHNLRDHFNDTHLTRKKSHQSRVSSKFRRSAAVQAQAFPQKKQASHEVSDCSEGVRQLRQSQRTRGKKATLCGVKNGGALLEQLFEEEMKVGDSLRDVMVNPSHLTSIETTKSFSKKRTVEPQSKLSKPGPGSFMGTGDRVSDYLSDLSMALDQKSSEQINKKMRRTHQRRVLQSAKPEVSLSKGAIDRSRNASEHGIDQYSVNRGRIESSILSMIYDSKQCKASAPRQAPDDDQKMGTASRVDDSCNDDLVNYNQALSGTQYSNDLKPKQILQNNEFRSFQYHEHSQHTGLPDDSRAPSQQLTAKPSRRQTHGRDFRKHRLRRSAIQKLFATCTEQLLCTSEPPTSSPAPTADHIATQTLEANNPNTLPRKSNRLRPQQSRSATNRQRAQSLRNSAPATASQDPWRSLQPSLGLRRAKEDLGMDEAKLEELVKSVMGRGYGEEDKEGGSAKAMGALALVQRKDGDCACPVLSEGVGLSHSTSLLNEILERRLESLDLDDFQLGSQVSASQGERQALRLQGRDAALENAFDRFRLRFFEVYLKTCTMNQSEDSLLQAVRVEPKTIVNLRLQRFQGSFCSIFTRGMPQPLYFTASHADFGGYGAHIFWSKKNPRPTPEDSEGSFTLAHPKHQVPKHEYLLESRTFTIYQFGDSSFSTDYVYLGLYTFTDDLKVTMSFSFKDPRNCRGILRKELKERYKEQQRLLGLHGDSQQASARDGKAEASSEDGHHHHHHGEEIDHLHDHDATECAVCTRPQQKGPKPDWHIQMAKFIKMLQEDGNQRELRNLENQLLNIRYFRRLERLKRQRAQSAQRESRLSSLTSIDGRLTKDQRIEKCRRHRHCSAHEDYKYKNFLRIRQQVLVRYRFGKVVEAVLLNNRRRRLVRWITLIQAKQMKDKYHDAFSVEKEIVIKQNMRHLKSLLIQARFRRAMRRRADHPEKRRKILLRQALNLLTSAAAAPAKRKAKAVLALFLQDQLTFQRLKKKFDKYFLAVVQIQRRIRRFLFNDFFRSFQEKLKTFVEQGVEILIHLLQQHPNQKKIKKQYPKLLKELTALRKGDAIIEVVKSHIFYTQQLHTLNLLRWYGKFTHQYNKESFFKIYAQMRGIMKKNKDCEEYALEHFPSEDDLRTYIIQTKGAAPRAPTKASLLLAASSTKQANANVGQGQPKAQAAAQQAPAEKSGGPTQAEVQPDSGPKPPKAQSSRRPTRFELMESPTARLKIQVKAMTSTTMQLLLLGGLGEYKAETDPNVMALMKQKTVRAMQKNLRERSNTMTTKDRPQIKKQITKELSVKLRKSDLTPQLKMSNDSAATDSPFGKQASPEKGDDKSANLFSKTVALRVISTKEKRVTHNHGRLDTIELNDEIISDYLYVIGLPIRSISIKKKAEYSTEVNLGHKSMIEHKLDLEQEDLKRYLDDITIKQCWNNDMSSGDDGILSQSSLGLQKQSTSSKSRGIFRSPKNEEKKLAIEEVAEEDEAEEDAKASWTILQFVYKALATNALKQLKEIKEKSESGDSLAYGLPTEF